MMPGCGLSASTMDGASGAGQDLDNKTSLRVSVEDEAFKARVRRGEVAIGANDTLHVTLRSAEYVTNTGEIGQRHSIISVNRYEAGHVEEPLF